MLTVKILKMLNQKMFTICSTQRNGCHRHQFGVREGTPRLRFTIKTNEGAADLRRKLMGGEFVKFERGWNYLGGREGERYRGEERERRE